MELRIINTFLHIAELRSFSRAARELGYSQSAVSAQIAQLEAELETPLFDRVGKTVRLTDAGQTFLSYARTLLATSEQAKAALQPARQVGGTLRIALADSLCSPASCGRWIYRNPSASWPPPGTRWRQRTPSRWRSWPGRSFCSPSGA